MSCAFWGRNMRHAPVYRAVDPACSRVGRATQAAGTFLAALCLFFGPAFAASVPASLEARIVYLFFFGLIPALGFYVSGHILRQMCWCSVAGYVRSIPARCVRRLVPCANGLANWAGATVLDVLDRCLMIIARCLLTTGQWMHRLSRLGQEAYCSIHCRYWHKAIFEFSCLLIRNTARFVIRMQRRSTERSEFRAFIRRYEICLYHFGQFAPMEAAAISKVGQDPEHAGQWSVRNRKTRRWKSHQHSWETKSVRRQSF